MVGCADLVAYRTLCERDQLEQQCTHLLWLAIFTLLNEAEVKGLIITESVFPMFQKYANLGSRISNLININ